MWWVAASMIAFSLALMWLDYRLGISRIARR